MVSEGEEGLLLIKRCLGGYSAYVGGYSALQLLELEGRPTHRQVFCQTAADPEPVQGVHRLRA